MPYALKLALVGLTGISAITDLYSRRIPNPVIVAGFIAGVALNTWLGGWGGLLHSLSGFGLAILIYVPLFILRAMGGGDVKLMAAAGAIVGPSDWFTLFIFASLAGGAIALGMLLARNATGRRILENDAYFERTCAFPGAIQIAARPGHFQRPGADDAAWGGDCDRRCPAAPRAALIAAGARWAQMQI